MFPRQMNIGNNKNTHRKGFMSTIAPYATAASGAALGFIVGGPAGGIAGGKLGYELGQGNVYGFFQDAANVATGGMMPDLPISNKRKRE